MVIDPTDNETSISLLFSLGICERRNTHICAVADFPDDKVDLVQCSVILQIKQAMEKGSTVILVNSSTINHCFSDIFNCYYTILSNRSNEYLNHKDKKIYLLVLIYVGSNSMLTSMLVRMHTFALVC